MGSDDDTGRPAGGLRLSCRGLLGRRGERAREFAVVVIPFATGGLDRLQDRPHRIDHRIQRAGDAVIERGLAVPEFAEQMLPAVGERPELRKPEKAAVALDGVNRAEHARQPLRISRVGLQREQVLVELIEVFTRLDEKLRNELAVVRHPFPAVAAGRGVIDGAGRERPVIYGDFAACPWPAIIPPEPRRDRDDPDLNKAGKTAESLRPSAQPQDPHAGVPPGSFAASRSGHSASMSPLKRSPIRMSVISGFIWPCCRTSVPKLRPS